MLIGCAEDQSHANSATGDKVSAEAGLSQNVKDRLALCGAGITAGMSAGLEAKVGKTIQEGAKLDANVKQEIRAAFFEGTNAANEQANHAYDRYVTCVERPL
jgi:hypothetical protein